MGCPDDGTVVTDCEKLPGMDNENDDDVNPSSYEKRNISEFPVSHHLVDRASKTGAICNAGDIRIADFMSAGDEHKVSTRNERVLNQHPFMRASGYRLQLIWWSQRSAISEWWTFESPTCDNFAFKNVYDPIQKTPIWKSNFYATEHLLEWHLLQEFWGTGSFRYRTFTDPAGGNGKVDFCNYWGAWWAVPQQLTIPYAPYNSPSIIFPPGRTGLNPAQWVGYMFPSHNNQWENEFVMLEGSINGAKGRVRIWYS